MAQITLAGQNLPLCLTLAAVDQLRERGLGLADISQLYTTGEGRSVQDLMDNAVWFLAVLIREGQANASLRGMDVPVPPPDEMLRHLLTPGQVIHEVVPALVGAVSEGLGRTVEADHSKNGAGATEEA